MSKLSYPFVVNHGKTGLTVTSLQDETEFQSETTRENLITSCRSFYDQLSLTLESSGIGKTLFFLNYGYVEVDDNNDSRREVARGASNRDAIRLGYELIGSTSVDSRDVLDIGCGRGGLSLVMASEFGARVTGVDLSSLAIDFCRANHGSHHNLTFVVGNAENLPIADSAFDVVTNLESSHCYPDIKLFLHEVRRVLRPRGIFLYADLLEPESWQAIKTEMSQLGLTLTTERDVTENILASRDRAAAIEAKAPRDRTQLMKNFLGLPGSLTYNHLRDGLMQYRILKAVAASQPVLP
jgi:phthiocerol/phenolphthiocerol synthesis type-I polyketide synthase E